LAENFYHIKSRLKEGVKVCCVIKADGYGHGAVMLGREYEKLGANWFAVSNIEEALELRRGGITLPILILGYTPPVYAAVLAENKISQAVLGTDYAEKLSAEAMSVADVTKDNKITAADARLILRVSAKLDKFN